MKRVLVVRQENKLGDVLLTTPAFQQIKRHFPECHITAMIQRDQHPVLQHNPYVDALWYTEYKPPASKLLSLARQIRSGRFDAVFLMKYNSSMHTIASWLARVPVRAGNSHKYYAALLTHNLRDDLSLATTHAVEYSTRIVQLATGADYDDLRILLPFPQADRQAAEQRLHRLGLQRHRYFCVHPGTGGSSHCWYPHQYARIADTINRETGLTVVVTGTRPEQQRAQVIVSRLGERAVNLVGETNLYETAVIVEGARFVLSGDTGIVHVAAATKTPCVIVHTVSEYQHPPDYSIPTKPPTEQFFPKRYAQAALQGDATRRGSTACALSSHSRLSRRFTTY